MKSTASLTSNKNQSMWLTQVWYRREGRVAWGWQVDPCVLPIGAQSERELTEKLGFKPKLKTSAWQKAQ